MTEELRPEVFTADYTGQPGGRTFFLQSKAGEASRSYLIEKQQVLVLAEKVKELLMLVDLADPVAAALPERDPAFRLDVPIEPEWRVGTIGLSYDESGDEVVISMQPAPENVEAEPEEVPEIDEFTLRVVLRRDQARSFALHALAIVGEGRPICQLCGLPMDPEGHKCPASNGHNLG
jgi:uncharacterized repeat protein (TIGR03847 family)